MAQVHQAKRETVTAAVLTAELGFLLISQEYLTFMPVAALQDHGTALNASAVTVVAVTESLPNKLSQEHQTPAVVVAAELLTGDQQAHWIAVQAALASSS